MLRYLPNALTFSRLLLAGPLGYFILQQEYEWALATGLLAGLTDGLDGFMARRLDALSRLGAALDPIADKVLITVSFVCFASNGLIPWYLALAVIIRDLVIVLGAACYHWLVGPFEFSATALSKANMFVQICFCMLVLVAQVTTWIPSPAITAGTVAVLFIAGASGSDYVLKWSARAVQQHREKQ
ncbi:MAG: CDP-alcohol phosphatidyltransferase family protein [Halieaceae bacterium]|nr:CDP-alcohol phosphatidyltransferase family protein [Halieaceae bacterium]